MVYSEALVRKAEITRKQRIRRFLLIMTVIVTFVTVYALTLPATTWQKTIICEQEEHVHTEKCFEDAYVMICGKEDDEKHLHDAECFADCLYECKAPEDEELKALRKDHEHDEDCYQEVWVLNCENEEEDHVHDYKCYEKRLALVCPEAEELKKKEIEEALEEATDPEEIEKLEAEQTKVVYVLECDKKEHIHAEACFDAPPAEEEGYTCGRIEHEHSKEQHCYNPDGELICTMDEHVHTDECLLEEEDEEEVTAGDEQEAAEEIVQSENPFMESSGTLTDRTGLPGVDNETIVDNEVVTGGENEKELSYSVTTSLLGAGNESVAATWPNFLPSINTANQWQIIAGKYQSSEQSYKTADSSTNPKVYYQKNVVPTGTENEFLVYLSLDKQATLESLIDNSQFLTRERNNYTAGTICAVEDKMGIISVHGVDPNGKNTIGIKLNITDSRGNIIYVYQDRRVIQTSLCSNGTFFLEFTGSGLCLCLGNRIQFNEDPITLTVPLSYFTSGSGLENTYFDYVIDEMGDYVTYEGVVRSDGEVIPQYEDPNAEDRVTSIRWEPIDNASATPSMVAVAGNVSGWEKNISQLVYKVRLNVEKKDFDSCVENMNSTSTSRSDAYPVNQEAKVYYHFEAIKYKNSSGQLVPMGGVTPRTPTSGTLDQTFPVPYIQGALYNVVALKQDYYTGEPKAGATFTIVGMAENTSKQGVYKGYPDVESIPPTDNNKCVDSGTTDGNGQFKFTYLVGLDGAYSGNYVVTETSPPPKYLPSNDTIGISMGNYTNNKAAYTKDGENFLLTGVKGPIKNKPIPEVKILKVDVNDHAKVLEGAKFEVRTDPDDAASRIMEITTDENGIATTKSGDDPLGLGTYYLVETETPAGYVFLDGPVILNIGYDSAAADASITASVSGDPLEVSIERPTGKPPVYTFTVENGSGYEMPHTGGMGVLPITTLGTLLVLIAMIGIRKRYYQERRSE